MNQAEEPGAPGRGAATSHRSTTGAGGPPATLRVASPAPIDAPDATAASGRYTDRRDAILAAAASTFNEQGIGSGTLADIAGRLGLAPNSVSYYFPRKDDLALACFLEAILAHEERIARAAQQDTAAARIEEFIVGQAGLLADIATGRRPPLVVFSEVRGLDGALREAVHEAYVGMFRAVRGLLQGADAPALDRAELNARTHLLLSTANFMRAWISRAEPESYASVARALAGMLVRGLAATGSQWQAESGPEAGWTLVGDTDTPAGRFLCAATGLLNERGSHGASVAGISAVLNVTKGSFYHHMRSKEELVLACFERSLGAIRAAASRAQLLPGSGWDRLGAMTRALARFQTSAAGPLLRVGALGALPALEGRGQAWRRMFQVTYRIDELIVSGMVDGSIRPVDCAIAGHYVTGGITALSELHYWLDLPDPDGVAPHYLRPLFEGILVPPA